MTHEQLFLKLLSDENIYENIDISDDYEKDKYGNSMITMAFESPGTKKKKAVKGFLVFVFNAKGRLVNMEVATKEKGQRNWQIATSEAFINFALKGFTE